MITERFQLACQIHQAGDLALALKHYHDILQSEPSFTPAHYNLGLLFLAQNQFEYARIQFNNVLELQPTHLKAINHLAACNLHLNNLDKAEHYFQQYCAVAPDDPDALNNLGVVYLRQQRSQEAADNFSRALAIDPTRTDIRSNLAATFLNFDRYEQAITHYEIILQDSSDLECHYNIAVALSAMGAFTQAVKHYEKIIAVAPDHLESHTNLGAIALHQGRRSDAEAHFARSLRINPQAPIASFLYSALQGKSEKSTPAEYTRNLFDHYAVHYDRHLLNTLRYQLPQLLKTIFDNLTELPAKPWRILDCGAGTGLVGEVFKVDASYLCGIDISEKMLKSAADKNCYNELHCADLRVALATISETFDIIFCADVFGYCGELSEILQNCYDRLKPGGILAFSVETCEADNFNLQTTARFAYSLNYIEKLRVKLSWNERYSKTQIIRHQENQPVPAQIILWQR